MFQVSNVSSIVWELEKFDENNVLLTHREIATLKKQLADCEVSVTNPNSGLSPSGNWTPEFGESYRVIVGWNFSLHWFVYKLHYHHYHHHYHRHQY